MELSAQSFIHANARIQRLSAGTFLPGWVEKISDSEALVRCAPEDQLIPGEKFFIELQKRGRAMFMAMLTHLGEPVLWQNAPRGVKLNSSIVRTATFKVKSSMRFYDGRGVSRSLRALSVRLDHSGGHLHAATTDVSSHGIGVLSSQALQEGGALRVNIDTRSGLISCRGVVRYCKRDPEFKELFRVGIELTSLTPQDSARLTGEAALA